MKYSFALIYICTYRSCIVKESGDIASDLDTNVIPREVKVIDGLAEHESKVKVMLLR